MYFVILTGLTWGQTRQWNYQMQDISSLLTSSTTMIRFVNGLSKMCSLQMPYGFLCLM